MNRPTVMVFVKEPLPGRVKTRLARDTGRAAAAHWYRTQTARLLRDLATDPRWTTVLCVSPDRQGLTSRFWPSGVARLAQGTGDLGQRMARALRAAPSAPALIVGSDVPHLRAHHVAGALRMLGRHDAVFGPSTDGGYWSVGVRNAATTLSRRAFRDVRWSTEFALEDSIASLHGTSIGLTERLDDVDTYADLKRLSALRSQDPWVQSFARIR